MNQDSHSLHSPKPSVRISVSPFSRAEAEALLSDFKARIEKLIWDPHYLYRVRKAVVFGDYVEGRSQIKKVRIGLDLEKKPVGDQMFLFLCLQRSRTAEKEGVRFKGVRDRSEWPESEAWNYLRGTDPRLSVEQTDDVILKEHRQEEIYRHRD